MDEILGTIAYFFLFMTPFLLFYFKRQLVEMFVLPRAAHTTDVPTAPMTGVKIKSIQNPFLITLDHVKSTAKEGIYLQQIKSGLDKMNMLVAWNVNIDQFYKEFERDANIVFQVERPFLSNCSKLVQLKTIEKKDYSEEIYLEIPNECKDLSNPENQVKKTYPVVFLLYRENFLDITLNDIVCSAWIIHLKDTQMTTKILYNYTKCKNNRIITLNQIYNSDQDNLCVACQTEISSLVLLPCSHSCVCTECFKRIGKNCPVCRTTIQSHFSMVD